MLQRDSCPFIRPPLHRTLGEKPLSGLDVKVSFVYLAHATGRDGTIVFKSVSLLEGWQSGSRLPANDVKKVQLAGPHEVEKQLLGIHSGS
jgi:hypothetical protein